MLGIMPAGERVMMSMRRPGQVGDSGCDSAHHADEVDVDGIDEIGISHGHEEHAGVGHDDVDPVEVVDPGLPRVAKLVAHAGVDLTRIRRPSFLTARSVSARSSKVDSGYGFDPAYRSPVATSPRR